MFELHSACVDLELDGHTDWYVPSRAEMTVWANDVLEKNYVGPNEWSDYKFWTSEASSDTTGYVYDKNAGAFYNEDKTNSIQVYCVRAVTP